MLIYSIDLCNRLLDLFAVCYLLIRSASFGTVETESESTAFFAPKPAKTDGK